MLCHEGLGIILIDFISIVGILCKIILENVLFSFLVDKAIFYC